MIQSCDGEDARILSVRLERTQVVIRSIHAPPGSSKGWRKIDLFRALVRAVEATHEPQVVCGDFNEPRREMVGGLIESWAGYNSHSKRNSEAWRDAVESVLRGKLLVDAFYQLEKDGVLKLQSFPRDGRRYDHVLASPRLPPSRACYLDLDNSLSDHCAAVVDF